MKTRIGFWLMRQGSKMLPENLRNGDLTVKKIGVTVCTIFNQSPDQDVVVIHFDQDSEMWTYYSAQFAEFEPYAVIE